CDDMHNCSTSTGDSFLKNDANIQAVVSYVLQPANHAIMIIVWDESESTSLLAMILVAPTATLSSGHAMSTLLTHSSLVKSFQEIFGASPASVDPITMRAFPWLRHAGDSGVSDLGSFFAAGQFP